MEPTLIIVVCCMALGLVVGLLAGMLGIGGGLIIVPVLSYLLVHFLGMGSDAAMPFAVATSLSTIIFTGASSARTHYKLGNLNSHIVIYCGIGIAFGAVAGAHIASQISGHMLKNVFAALVILIALQMIFGKRSASRHSANKPILIGIGGITGVVSALMGIGGGALLVPALIWFNVNIRQAIGCAALSGLIIALFGSASFVANGLNVANLPSYAMGYVYLPATFGIVVTSMFTANVGARLGQKMNTEWLKRLLAVLLVAVSIKMIIGLE